MKTSTKRKIISAVSVAVIVIAAFAIKYFIDAPAKTETDFPPYSGKAYETLNLNVPSFDKDSLSTESFEYYSELDSLGRCGMAYACLGKDLMPSEDRESISHVKPSGWKSVSYSFVPGNSLYNRCHLIGFQLAGENANERNLVTGTRSMNVDGMLPFENMVADYIKETGNHVMYRVTPVFTGNKLVCDGVHMEALSVEDNGLGIEFNVFVYNEQKGVIIDKATGDSRPEKMEETTDEIETFIINTKSKKVHREDCDGAKSIKASNKKIYKGKLSDLIEDGYSPCSICNKK